MTGSLIVRRTRAGKEYFHIQLSYKNPETGKWCQKSVSTKLEVKGHKRIAEKMIPDIIEKYAYLEKKAFDNALCDKNVLLESYITTWLASKKGELRTSTFDAYSYRVQIIKDTLCSNNYKVSDLTPSILDNYFRYLLAYGKTNQKTGEKEPMKVRTVRCYKSLLYSVLDQAVLDGILNSNPLNSVKVRGKKNSDYAEQYVFLTEDEIGQFLHFLQEHYPFLVDIAFFGAYYGLRRSEILGLKWSAIDYQRKYIRISHTIVRVKKTEANDITKTTASMRDLNLFPTAEKCLNAIRRRQNENKEFFGNTYKNKDGYVIVAEDGSPYNPDYISKSFHKATKEFGRPEITLHKLRHSCASMLIEKGWDVKRVQYWLGHDDINCTLAIYAHYDKQKLNRNENDLSAISEAAADLF